MLLRGVSIGLCFLCCSNYLSRSCFAVEGTGCVCLIVAVKHKTRLHFAAFSADSFQPQTRFFCKMGSFHHELRYISYFFLYTNLAVCESAFQTAKCWTLRALRGPTSHTTQHTRVKQMHFALCKRTLSPASHVLEDTSYQTRPKIDAGDVSLLMGSIN